MHNPQYICELDTKQDKLIFYIPASQNVSEESIARFGNFTLNAEQEFKIINKLSIEQMKLIWVLCREYGEILGYEKEEVREWLQTEFCMKRHIGDFSISPRKREAATMEIATEFIQYIIEHSICNGYNLILHEGKGKNKKIRHAREIVPDIKRWVLAHLMNKSCAVCGANTELEGVDLHHEPPLGSVGYEHDTGMFTGFLSLCRKHHTERHNIGWKAFSERYHLQEVWLKEYMVSNLLSVYPGHFKAFRKQIREEKKNENKSEKD